MKMVGSSPRTAIKINHFSRGAHFSNSLVGSFGKGSLQKCFREFLRNLRKLSVEFRTLPDARKRSFCKFPAIITEFPQNSPQNKPFAHEPISELLIIQMETTVFGNDRGWQKSTPEKLQKLNLMAEKTMTATDVTGFDAIFSTGFFATFSRF